MALKHSEPSDHNIFACQFEHSILTCDFEGCPCTIVAPDLSGQHDACLYTAKAGGWEIIDGHYYCIDHKFQ